MWRFGFFDAVETAPGVYDRVYNAEEFSVPFSALIDTGVLEGAGDSLEVTTDGSSMQTTIGTGVAFIRGRYAENTSPRAHTHDTETVGVDRIDRIVIRLDLRPEARHVESFVKKGVASANPVPPALQRDDNVYEISLAQVRIRGGQTFISPSDITDERGDEDICPWARSKVLPHIDAQDVIDLRNDFESFKAEVEPIVQQPTEIVTVGSGGDFATINEALEYLSQRHARFWQEGYTAEIRLLFGFVMEEQVFVEGVDLGWITITSEAVEVTINRAALTESVEIISPGSISSERYPAFAAFNGATLPIIGVLFNMNNSGESLQRDGFLVAENSNLIIKPDGGIKNVGIGSVFGTPTPHGILATGNSRVMAARGIFSGCAVGVGVDFGSSVVLDYANISDTIFQPVSVSYGSRLSAHDADLSNGGWEGVSVIYNSTANLLQANISGSGGDGLHVTGGSVVNAGAANLTNNERGILSAAGSFVNANSADTRVDGVSDGPDDMVVSVGGIISAHEALGGTNITKNTLTPNGIIFG